MFLAYLLFFLAGAGFGYAGPGPRTKLLPLLFPLALGLVSLLRDGFESEIVVRLIVALIITGAGVLLGMLLDQRSRRREAAGSA